MHQRLPAKREFHWRTFSASVGLALVMSSTAFALQPTNWTDGELALTPEYCPDTMGFKYGDASSTNTSPRAASWVALMGKGFWAMHHYCWGLINLRRTLATVGRPELRRGNLGGVLGDYQYVINNVPPNFVLLPEIYTKVGDVHVYLSDFSAAFVAYQHARNLKPNYWPAYSQWADVLTKSGQKEDAKKLLKVGLQYAPGTPALLDRFRALGGTPSEIEANVPIAPAQAGGDGATAVMAPTNPASAAAPLQ